MIESKFSGKLTITIGTKHVYLGMGITFTENRNIEIRMSEYIREALKAFGEEITCSATTPVKRELFEEEEGSPVLGQEKEEKFQHIMAKLLYVSK